MNKLIKKYRINKITELEKGSDICEYILKCYNSNKLEIDYIYIMIKKSIDKLGANQLYKLFLQIPFDDELTKILNDKMSVSYDRKVSVDYMLSEKYKSNYQDEINILTKIFSEKNNYELEHHCNNLLKSKRFISCDDTIPSILKAACNSKKGLVIYNVVKKLNLSKESINLLIDTLSEINDIKYVYLLLKDVNVFSEEEIIKIIDIICKSENDEYIYKTSLEFPEYKTFYRNALLNSRNIYYLTLYILYVDDILITSVFSNRVRMLEYMKLYNFELKDIEYAGIKFNYNMDNLQTINDKINNNVNKLCYELNVNKEKNFIY